MIRLRQVAFAASDLAAGERALADGLGLELCYRDPNVSLFGLENALFPIGDQFFEIVSPTEPDTTAGRLLAKRGGDTGYMVLFQVDDLAPVEARLARHDVRVVFDADTADIRGLHLHPKDVPGAIVSIDAARDPADWPWAGPAWRDHVRTDVSSAIVGLHIATDDPAGTCQRWAEVLGLAPVEGRRIVLDDATVHFVPAERGDGIVAIDVAGAASRRGRELVLFGVTIRLV